jgi:hypothetical protein
MHSFTQYSSCCQKVTENAHLVAVAGAGHSGADLLPGANLSHGQFSKQAIHATCTMMPTTGGSIKQLLEPPGKQGWTGSSVFSTGVAVMG